MRICAYIMWLLFLSLDTSVLHGQSSLPPGGSKSAEGVDKEALEWARNLAQTNQKDPVEYAALAKLITLTTQMSLTRLGYDMGSFDGILTERTTSAIKLYERNRKLPVTGSPLTYATVQKVKADIDAIDRQPVFLPSKIFGDQLWEKGWVYVTGTWQLKNDSAAYPEQTTQFECDRSRMTCIDVTASVSHAAGPLLNLDTTHYDIERWDEYEIATKPSESAMGCTRHVVRINRVQKSATMIRSTISSNGLCKGVSRRELYGELVDGSDVWKQRNAAWRQLLNEIMVLSPEARAILKR